MLSFISWSLSVLMIISLVPIHPLYYFIPVLLTIVLYFMVQFYQKSDFAASVRSLLVSKGLGICETDGWVQPGFESVREAFKKNFENGLEKNEGSAFAVYHNGKMVVDLWGGYADSDADRKWKENTLTTVYSVTKSVCALCLAVLVDRGLISFDDLVISYWPEFGKNGKEKTTVKMLATHEAGLVALDMPITFETIRDWTKMSAIIENQKPNWEVGTATGYHSLTYGWLIDQLLRRVDPKKRSLGHFFREEIAEPHGIDFYIGLPAELEYRVTKLKKPSVRTLLEYCLDFDVLALGYKIYSQPSDSIQKRAIANPKWLEGSWRAENAFNDPKLHALEIGAANGIGTARALAKLFSIVDSEKIIKKATLDILLQPLWIDTVELTMRTTTTWGWGFYHTKNPEGKYQIGHPGYGGQYLKYDPHHKLSFAYLRNGLIYTGQNFHAKSLVNLEKAVYDVLQRMKQY